MKLSNSKDDKLALCKLIHSRVPVKTGEIKWHVELEKWVPETTLKCKEGCDDIEHMHSVDGYVRPAPSNCHEPRIIIDERVKP